MDDITQILIGIEQGDTKAAEQLLPLVYDELKRLAAQKLSREAPGQTLQPTALVHEAYLRLVSGRVQSDDAVWDGRGHFFAAAADAMRRILIESARRRQTKKRGGDQQRREFVEERIAAPQPDVALLELNDALDALAEVDARKAELVKLRYFAGLTIPEAAALLKISTSTAEGDWAFSRAWLHQEILQDTATEKDKDSAAKKIWRE